MHTAPSVRLSADDRERLRSTIRKGKHLARVIHRARILLRLDGGETPACIARAEEVCERTVVRICDRLSEGLDRALFDAPRSGRPATLDDESEAHLVAIVCTDAPEGTEHWTLDLLRERMLKDKKTSACRVTLWHTLHERGIKPWREKNVVHPEAHAGVR